MPPPVSFIRKALPGAKAGYLNAGELNADVDRKIYVLETSDNTLQEIFIDGTPNKKFDLIDGDFVHLCQVYAAAKQSDAAGGGYAKWYDNTKFRANKIGGGVTVDGPAVGGPGNSGGTGGTLLFGLDADPGNNGIRAQVQGNPGETWRWIVVVDYILINFA
jgi:hypothetical protein